MGFNRSDIDFEIIQDGSLKSRPLKLSTKIPRSRSDVDGSNPFGGQQNKNPSQTKHSVKPVGISQKQAAKKQPSMRNVSKQRAPDSGFSKDPNARTGGSPSGETPSKAKKDKGPARMNTVPKARQRRIPIGRNKD